jgi:hypothetical protein
MITLSLKIYNPCWGVDVAADWGINAESADLTTVLQQPFRIAALPVMWNCPGNFANTPDLPKIPVDQFDLIVLSDIETNPPEAIYQWMDPQGPRSYITALGSISNVQPVDSSIMTYRPWWMYNLKRLNYWQDTSNLDKSYMFDVLLGTRRPHRDFVMLNLQRHRRLLDNSIVTYRSVFTGGFVDCQSHNIATYFSDFELQWPYVSDNLDPAWEVSSSIEKNMSPFLPYEIYRRTWYSAVCETLHTGDQFFLTEKTSKPLFAKRLFVMFSSKRHLENLQKLGFETFGSVIDESYDQEDIDLRRYQMAFDQMLSLSQQDPRHVLEKVQPILEHNHNRMCQLQQETQQDMTRLLTEYIPLNYVKPNCVF